MYIKFEEAMLEIALEADEVEAREGRGFWEDLAR